MAMDMSPDMNAHMIHMYENNVFKEARSASEFPEGMRYRESIITTDDGKKIICKVPVKTIKILFSGTDGKLTTQDKAVVIEITDYDDNGKMLFHTYMKNDVK